MDIINEGGSDIDNIGMQYCDFSLLSVMRNLTKLKDIQCVNIGNKNGHNQQRWSWYWQHRSSILYLVTIMMRLANTIRHIKVWQLSPRPLPRDRGLKIKNVFLSNPAFSLSGFEFGLLLWNWGLNGHRSPLGFASKSNLNRQILGKLNLYEHPLYTRQGFSSEGLARGIISQRFQEGARGTKVCLVMIFFCQLY